MRVAVPCENNRVCPHFGHAPEFGFFDVNPDTNRIEKEEFLAPPPHQPGVLPQWIASQGASVVLAGGMGGRAVALFQEHGVDVVVGAASDDPRKVVEDYFNGSLETRGNVCDHNRGGRGQCGGH